MLKNQINVLQSLQLQSSRGGLVVELWTDKWKVAGSIADWRIFASEVTKLCKGADFLEEEIQLMISRVAGPTLGNKPTKLKTKKNHNCQIVNICPVWPG